MKSQSNSISEILKNYNLCEYCTGRIVSKIVGKPSSKFLGKKPEGMHHIALIVDNIQLALNYLNENNVQLIDSSPRIGAEGLQVAFIHPKSTGGVLVELCEKQ